MLTETRFDSLGLSKTLVEALSGFGFEKLTPVQAQSIPLLLQGRDLVGQSKTGSGKTLAFALPILEKIRLEPRALQALILCPTRELCTQVAREFRRLGSHYRGLQVLMISGGQPLRPQLMAVDKGVHIVVGTPGRVLDLIRRGRLNLSAVDTLVLDEADRMLDMGFEDEMKAILAEVPGTRQTVFFSATFPPSISQMILKYQHQPEYVTIEDGPEPSPAIEQFHYELDEYEKPSTLLQILNYYQPESAIVFCNQKITVAEVAERLIDSKLSVAALHGDLEQFDRDRVLAKFRNGSTRVLVATDVAARGLDIKDLSMVINWDVPFQADDYIHRIGRTGRAGQKGMAITLVTTEDAVRLAAVERVTGTKLEKKRRDFSSRMENSARPKPRDAEMRTLTISGGRKEKVRPGDILGALTGEAGFDASAVGKIEIHDHFSYVAVARSIADVACKKLQEGRIKGRRFDVRFVE